MRHHLHSVSISAEHQPNPVVQQQSLFLPDRGCAFHFRFPLIYRPTHVTPSYIPFSPFSLFSDTYLFFRVSSPAAHSCTLPRMPEGPTAQYNLLAALYPVYYIIPTSSLPWTPERLTSCTVRALRFTAAPYPAYSIHSDFFSAPDAGRTYTLYYSRNTVYTQLHPSLSHHSDTDTSPQMELHPQRRSLEALPMSGSSVTHASSESLRLMTFYDLRHFLIHPTHITPSYTPFSFLSPHTHRPTVVFIYHFLSRSSY